MTDARAFVLRLWVSLTWLAMAILAGVLLLMFWPFVRETQGGPRHRRGIARPARDTWQPTPPGVGQWTSFSLDPKRGIEETRLMPGAEQRDPGDENDQVAEGLGLTRPVRPSHVTPDGALDPSTRRALEELEREAHS